MNNEEVLEYGLQWNGNRKIKNETVQKGQVVVIYKLPILEKNNLNWDVYPTVASL